MDNNNPSPWQVNLADLPPQTTNSGSSPTTNKVIVYIDYEGDYKVLAGPSGLEIEVWSDDFYDNNNMPYFEPHDYGSLEEFDKDYAEYKAAFDRLKALPLTKDGQRWLEELEENQDYSEEDIAEARRELQEELATEAETAEAEAKQCNGVFDRSSGSINHNPFNPCPIHS